jgi:chitinase
MRDAGAKQVILSAITAYRDKCTPAWGGFYSQVQQDDIAKWVREVGPQNVTISFGANLDNGKYLEQVCSAKELAVQYETIIEKYGVTSFDFNIEGDRESKNEQDNLKRIAAIEEVMKLTPDLKIGFTIERNSNFQSTSAGGNKWQLANIESFAQAGIMPSWVNLMVINAWSGFRESAVEVTTQYMGALIGQLDQILTKNVPLPMRSSEIPSLVGFTSANNQTGSGHKPFTVRDAINLYEIAKAQGWGEISPWIVNNDYPCQGTSRDAALCSDKVTEPYQFSKAFTGQLTLTDPTP